MEPHLADVPAVRAGIGFAVLLGLAALLVRTHADLTTGLVGYLGACVVAGLSVPLGYAALLGLSGWGLLTGFVVNSGGQLTFTDSDLTRLALLVALSAAIAVLRPRAVSRSQAPGRRRQGSRV